MKLLKVDIIVGISRPLIIIGAHYTLHPFSFVAFCIYDHSNFVKKWFLSYLLCWPHWKWWSVILTPLLFFSSIRRKCITSWSGSETIKSYKKRSLNSLLVYFIVIQNLIISNYSRLNRSLLVIFICLLQSRWYIN